MYCRGLNASEIGVIWVVVKIMVPFWVPQILGPKGTIILTTAHLQFFGLGSLLHGCIGPVSSRQKHSFRASGVQKPYCNVDLQAPV